ncbi:unnamed protein product [Parnassius apollo]|uniref:(apollo) hypothetical protein n=1 Tax=Parnassius apollo TaxID=110799 RepID=A0A8S3W6Y8_PARAO|nr:unnamed protein product [Parnassius apollo]
MKLKCYQIGIAPQCTNNAPRCSKQDSTPLRNINTGRGTKRPALNSPPNTTALNGADVKIIVQDVIRTKLSGTSILKEINNSLMEIINKELKPIKKEMKEINESMNFINNRFEDIEKEQAEAKKTSKELFEDNLKMKSIVSELKMRLISTEQRVNITEQYLRTNNLELHCVPES